MICGPLSLLYIILTVGYADGFVQPSFHSHSSAPAINHHHHLHHLHRHSHGACVITTSNYASLQSTSCDDVDIHANHDIIAVETKTAQDTAAAAATPLHLLSEEERNAINKLVNDRSEARWNGDYAKADELRGRIDNTTVIIPWSRILQHFRNNVDTTSSSAENTQQQEILYDRDDNVDLEYKVAIIDLPRSDGGGSTWELTPIYSPLVDNNHEGGQQKEDNILQLAHAALGMVVSASERGAAVDEGIMHELVSRAEHRLTAIKQRKEMSSFLAGAAAAAGELHGRKAADTILWFALAGITKVDMYNDLVAIATEELLRFGMNSSCRAKDVLHIVERVAMAGVVGESASRLYKVAADCLESKMESAHDAVDQTVTSDTGEEGDGGIDYARVIKSLRNSSFGLHSDRSLLGIWRFSTRQRKQRAFFQNAARHFDGQFRENGEPTSSVDNGSGKSSQYDWSTMFKDPTRPLVVDIGCGMGVSLLGLAKSHDTNKAQSDLQMDWSQYNFIGVDLSRLAIRYGQGICERWSIGEILNFVVDPAEVCLQQISESYPGEIKLAMIQFPTPYRFQNDARDEDIEEGSTTSVAKSGFNSQLPEGAASDHFMVTEKLLTQVRDTLLKHKGQLLIQSNCEDVAIHMKNVASSIGLQPLSSLNPVTDLAAVTQRAQNWVAMGGERAIGDCWSAEPLLPQGGRTETEVACILDSKPVHRCVFNTMQRR